jgi:hypothetical protein
MPFQRDPVVESSLCIPLEAIEALDMDHEQLRQYNGHLRSSRDKPDSFWFSTPKYV